MARGIRGRSIRPNGHGALSTATHRDVTGPSHRQGGPGERDAQSAPQMAEELYSSTKRRTEVEETSREILAMQVLEEYTEFGVGHGGASTGFSGSG